MKRVTSVPWWRGVDLAGLLGMTTMPSLTDPLWNLNPVGPVPGPLAPCCGSPLLDRTKTEPSSSDQRSPWTPACREVCANLWPWCSDWSSSTDELTGPLDASSVGRHCETSSVELHPNELQVLIWCEIGLLEVDDLAKNWSILKVVWACSWACSGVSALISQSSK